MRSDLVIGLGSDEMVSLAKFSDKFGGFARVEARMTKGLDAE